jgi:hypothetical protein
MLIHDGWSLQSLLTPPAPNHAFWILEGILPEDCILNNFLTKVPNSYSERDIRGIMFKELF